jgi:hypothetical protein
MRPTPFVPHFKLAPTDVTLASVAWPRVVEPEKVPTVDPTVVPTVDPPEVIKPTVTPTKIPRPVAELLDVAVIVRPFGYVQVDDGPRGVDALARHNLKVPPGPHRFRVTCELCETQGRSVTVDVKKGGEEIPMVAPLKPSLVSFRGWPDEAKVRVGALEKTVKESQELPFQISTLPSGNQEMRHRVEYSVSVDGKQIDKGVQYAEPGRPKTIEAAP